MARTMISLVLGLLPTSACTTELGSLDVTRDHAGEVSVSGDAVRNDWTHDDGYLISPVLEAGGGASRVGAMLTLDDDGPLPAIEVRPVRDGADVGEWRALESTWSEVSMHVAVAELGGVAEGAQLRIRLVDASHVKSLLWNAVIPETPSGEIVPPPEVAGSSEALRAELRSMGIVTRADWGARATRCRDGDASKSRIAIHYTVTPSENAERQVRGIQRYHMDTNGWCDVGYHFLVGVDGTIYEGRPLELLGAHVGGNNTGNVGIAFVGCFHPSRECAPWGPSRPPEAMIEAGGRLLGRIAELYGIAPSRGTVKGHKEHRGASTSCPGDHLLARMDDLIAIGRSGPVPGDPTPVPDSPADDPSAPSPAPAEGDSCTHSYGGAYGHTACSAGYQCCDGAWRTRASGCGACACVEETGTLGCTPDVTPPPPPGEAGPYAGLAQSGSEIPRAGLANGTLRAALGLATEPYGDVVTHEGRSYVRGKVSWFGGPSDTGVSSTETGAITGERLRSLTGYFVAMRWSYTPNGRTFWRDARILVVNPDTGARVVVRPVDWGPHTSTRRIVDLSPEALAALGLDTDDDALVAFAAPGTPTGPVR